MDQSLSRVVSVTCNQRHPEHTLEKSPWKRDTFAKHMPCSRSVLIQTMPLPGELTEGMGVRRVRQARQSHTVWRAVPHRGSEIQRAARIAVLEEERDAQRR